MRLYMGGGEIPSHRKTLAANGVTNVFMSYMGLRRRVKFARPWLIEDKFPANMRVLLDSGAYTVNRGIAEHDLDLDALVEIAAGYQDFISRNADRVDAFTEFDALPLGLDWLNTTRQDFYDDYGDKFMPVWHAEHGIDELERLASRYHRVGILQTSLGDRDLVPVLNLLAARRGTLLHGLAMTKPGLMREVRWDSVGSTSWVSPMQFGDTHIWLGTELKRYPKAYKDKARQEHEALFTREGFDAAKIQADDHQEVAKLTLWSWQQLMEDLNRHRPQTALSETESAQTLSPVLPPQDGSGSAGAVSPAPPTARQRILLPGVTLARPDGEENAQLGVRGDNLRQCDTCILRDRGCPGYLAGAACVYEMPIMVKTPSDIKALENAMIAMQTQRVMFMRMVEDLEGGHANPNLSNEVDRLTRMIKAQREGSADKFSLSINASRPAGESVLGMFGQNVVDAQMIEAPSAADTLIKESMMGEVYEAEVVERG